MAAEQRKSSRRSLPKAPIRYLHAEMDKYHDGFMYNYCETGLYIELFEFLNCDDRLHVIIPGHRTGAAGPAGFPCYLSQVRWCRELGAPPKPRYGVGVSILEKRYDLQWLPQEPQHRECAMCGENLTAERICLIDGTICLCPDCFYNLEEIPEGTVKEQIKRRLAGNIL